MSGLSHLKVAAGQEVRAEHLNAVVREIERRRFIAGPGVRLRQLDTHCIISYQAAPASPVHAWMPVPAAAEGGRPGVKVSRGFVNGVEPEVKGKKLSDPLCEPLEIPGYDDAGECRIVVEVTLAETTWRITKAEMKAYDKAPGAVPFVARKMVCIAREGGEVDARAFFDFGFAASDRKPGGRFQAWWWAV